MAAGALTIGNTILRGAKSFRRGIDATMDVGNGTVKSTVNKIKNTNVQIKSEKKKQKRFDDSVTEEVRRRAKEGSLEGKKITKGTASLLQKVVKKPLSALIKLLMAWVVDNLPRLIKLVENTAKRVRIFSAAIRSTFGLASKTIRTLGKIVVAYAKNIATFDFNDSKGRVKKAQAELDENIEDLGNTFGEMKNVWGREEEELDKILTDLESGQSLENAIKMVDSSFGGDDVEVQPTTSAVGPGSTTGGGGYNGKNAWGMKTNTATNTKWSEILDLIASSEAIDGSYSSAYNPGGSRIIPGLEGMSIKDAVAKSGGTDSNGRHYAIGRYQFTTLTAGQAANAGLSVDDKFSPENQDKMAIALITKTRGVSFDQIRKDPRKAQMALAKEWAGLAAPDTGRSYYADDGVNHHGRTTEQIQQTFKQTTAPKPKPQPATSQPPQPATSNTTANKPTTQGAALASSAGTLNKKRLDTSRYGRNGCVFAVNQAYKGAGLTPPWGTSVYVPTARSILLKKGYKNVGVKNALPGDIVIMADTGSPPWIHIGIVSNSGTVLHNSSSNQAFTNNETFASLLARYVKIEVYRKPGGNAKGASTDVTISSSANNNSEVTSTKLASNRTGAGSGGGGTQVVVARQVVKT